MKSISLGCVAWVAIVLCTVPAYAQYSVDGYADFWAVASTTRPADGQRAWSTQPWRTNTMAVNLVTVGLRYADSTKRGRVALQEGTFPQVNYVNADAAWRWIGEATVGVHIGNNTWIDAGIMPSHIGFESARPSANVTLTRSLIADFTPYYEAGVKVSHTTTGGLQFGILVLQGWQQIVDVNDDPAVGTLLSIPISDGVSLQWNTYGGNEAPRGLPTAIRLHSNLTLQAAVSESLVMAFLFDATIQRLPTVERATMLYGGLQVRHTISNTCSMGYRIEYASDRDGVLFVTNVADGFQTASGSINLDVAIAENVQWRTEARAFSANNPVFPSRDGNKTADLLVCSALAVSF